MMMHVASAMSLEDRCMYVRSGQRHIWVMRSDMGRNFCVWFWIGVSIYTVLCLVVFGIVFLAMAILSFQYELASEIPGAEFRFRFRFASYLWCAVSLNYF